jgi:hypothetical protein
MRPRIRWARGRAALAVAALTAAALAATSLAAQPAAAASSGTASSAVASKSAPKSSGTPAAAAASPTSSTALTPMDAGYGATPAEKTAMAGALATAAKTGEPVAVDALTTETWQVVAQPTGGFTLQANAAPVRTKRHGAWVPVDTTLHRNADGTLSPAATAYGTVAFSGGGNTPLATTTSGSTGYALSWPTALPAPRVSGSSATYPDVLPGVDLVMTATVSGGFSDVLVIKNAAAARNPKLSSLTLASRITGGHSAKPQAADGIAVAGNSDGTVLESSSALMWDSSTALPSVAPKTARNAEIATKELAAAAKAGPDRSDAAHAGAAARTAPIALSSRPGSLTLALDKSLLTSPATVFPIFADPTLNWHTVYGGTPAFDEVKQDSPCNGASYYDNSGSNADYGDLGVGVSWWGGCEGIQRAYYQWQLPHVIWGADINLATVNATEVYQASWSCSYSRTVNLHWAGGIGSGTDYNNQPGFVTGADAYSTSTTVGAAYNPSGCTNPSSSPAGFTVTTPIAKSAARHSTQFTVVLTQDGAESSGNDSGFDRFADNPTLNIQYNLRPNTPGAADLHAANSAQNVGCATSSPYPYMGKSIATNTPVLTAHVSDPDGDALQAQFQYWVDGTSTVHTALSADNVASGSPAGYSLPASFISSLSNGQTVDWNARVTDGEKQGGNLVWTGWSPTCHFTAEPTGPDAPAIPSNPTYPDTSAGGGTGAPAGTQGTFTINGATDGAPANKFIYNLDQPPATSGTPASETAAVTGTTASSPADRWKLADGSGSTGTDSAGSNPVTLTNATWGSDGLRGTILDTNGTDAYAATTGPVLTTTGSYSVSAWAYLTSTSNFATFVSQAGAVGSAFYLQYSHSANAWAFVVQDTDTSGAAQTTVHTATAPALNTWTHLVGVYDATAKTASLYVDGVLIGTSAVAATFNAGGPLVIGAVKTTAGAVSNQVPGRISDVQAYSRALTATEVNAMYASATVTVIPYAPGPHTLYAAAVDAAGDVSGYEAYPFLAAQHTPVTCASLAACLDNTAVSADSAPAKGDADGANSFSATDLANAGWKSGGSVTVDGANLTLPAFGSGPDNVLAANQTITYPYPVAPNGASSLMFLATSTNTNLSDPGSINGETTAPYVPAGTGVSGVYCFDSTNPSAFCPASGAITYTDGSSQSYFLTVPDWVSGPSSLAAVVLPHRNTQSAQQTMTTKLYPFSVPLEAGKTVKSITLPDVGNGPGTQGLHIFSIGTRDTTTGTVEANGGIAAAAANSSWTGAWTAPTEGSYNFQGSNFSDQTFRIAVKPSISGGAVRVKLDNALGTSPLTIGAATFALAQTSGGLPTAATAGAISTLTFGGPTATSTTIPEGGMVFSDPLTLSVAANQWLLVSFQISNSVPYLVQHSWANTAYTWLSASGAGNHTADTGSASFTGTGTYNGWFTDLLTGLDVQTSGYTVAGDTVDCSVSATVAGCVTGIPTQAVLGDGLIDAWQPNTAALGQNNALRLSDDLAATEPSTPSPYGTIAAGIESNQIMKDYPESLSSGSVGGPSALSRIDRDILDEPGISTVVLYQGLEDLLNGRTADDLDANGYTTLLDYLSGTTTGSNAYAATDTFINTDAVGITPCDGYTGDGATGASSNDPCTSTVDGYRTTANSWLDNNPTGLSPWSPASLYYVNPDTALGVTQPNGEVKLNADAAIGTSDGNTTPDYANLTTSGYGALASAILGPQDVWQLDDGAAGSTVATAVDSASNTSAYLANNPAVGQNSASLTGGYSWVDDPDRGYVLKTDGGSGYGATGGQVLNTAGSFTVSAWVNLASIPTSTGAVLSQEGSNNSGFYLWYNTGWKGWAFSFTSNDTTSYTWSAAGSSTAPATNSWTHLVGVYNATTKTAQLYVNGAVAATATGITDWNATGPLLIGAAKSDGGPLGYFFPGEISGAEAFNYALTAGQVTALYQQLGGLPSTIAVPDGYETGQTRSAGVSGTWSAAAQAATIPGATRVSAAGMPNGDTAYVTLAGGQEYIQWHYAADGSWSTVQLIDTSDSSGTLFTDITTMAATASTNSDGTGMLQILSVAGGTEHHQTWTAAAGWTRFLVPANSGSSVTAVAAAGFKDGTAQFMSVIGGVEYHQIRNADGSWTTFNKLGNSGVTAVAAAAMPNGDAQFESVVGGIAYNQARFANGSWSGFNKTGAYTGVTTVAAAPDADGSAQFLLLSGTTENWIQRNSDGSWTANVVVNSGVSGVALAGFTGAASTDAWYGTTQALTIS